MNLDGIYDNLDVIVILVIWELYSSYYHCDGVSWHKILSQKEILVLSSHIIYWKTKWSVTFNMLCIVLKLWKFRSKLYLSKYIGSTLPR